MNKSRTTLLITLILLLLLSISCNNNRTKFSIIGKTNSKYNNKMAVLSQFEGYDMIKSDTSKIDNGKFKFEGDQFLDCTATITIIDNYSALEYLTELILEKGKIEVYTEPENKVVGGKLNEEFQKYAKVRFYTDPVSKIIYANIDNPIGLILIQKNINVLSDTILNDMLEKGGDIIKENIIVKDALAEREEYNIIKNKRTESIGTKLPNINVITVDGTQKQLSDFIGLKPYTFISFWASWCGPCIAEIPELNNMLEKHQDISLVSMSTDENKEEWLKAIKTHEVPGINLLPTTYKEVDDLYHIYFIPYGVIIDKDGYIVAINVYPENVESLLESIKYILRVLHIITINI